MRQLAVRKHSHVRIGESLGTTKPDACPGGQRDSHHGRRGDRLVDQAVRLAWISVPVPSCSPQGFSCDGRCRCWASGVPFSRRNIDIQNGLQDARRHHGAFHIAAFDRSGGILDLGFAEGPVVGERADAGDKQRCAAAEGTEILNYDPLRARRDHSRPVQISSRWCWSSPSRLKFPGFPPGS